MPHRKHTLISHLAIECAAHGGGVVTNLISINATATVNATAAINAAVTTAASAARSVAVVTVRTPAIAAAVVTVVVATRSSRAPAPSLC
jgi:hypothetical protein